MLRISATAVPTANSRNVRMTPNATKWAISLKVPGSGLLAIGASSREHLRTGIWRRGWDSNPRCACTHAGFQDRCLKPLGHPSDAVNSILRLPSLANRAGAGAAWIRLESNPPGIWPTSSRAVLSGEAPHRQDADNRHGTSVGFPVGAGSARPFDRLPVLARVGPIDELFYGDPGQRHEHN